MSEVMGFQIKPKHNIRCDRCKRMIGRDCISKIAYEIREGIGQGTFCSGNCVNKARDEMTNNDESINELIDFELE